MRGPEETVEDFYNKYIQLQHETLGVCAKRFMLYDFFTEQSLAHGTHYSN